ncbi:MAG: BMC domain-containing protein [Treponema sp.]|nr:BMC domain-containing protein [Treponema sp.]
MKAGANHALGIIETAGRVPLIEAVDSAIKAAAVTLKMTYFVGGGLNTVTLVGDVGALRAALDAAKATIDRMGAVGQTLLIPCLAEAVWPLIMDQTNGRELLPRRKPSVPMKPGSAGDTAVKPSTPADPVVQTERPVPAKAPIQTETSMPEPAAAEAVGSASMENGTVDKNGGEEGQGERKMLFPDETPMPEQEIPLPKKKSGSSSPENKPRKRNPKPKG